MTSGSIRSASTALRADMLAEHQDLDGAQMQEIMEARRIHQEAAGETAVEPAAAAA